MKIKFKKENVFNALNISLKAVSSRTANDIFSYLLIDAEYDRIKFITNDNEICIETLVEGEIISNGKLALDAKLFYDIVRKTDDNDIEIILENIDEVLYIKAGDLNFDISYKHAEEFNYLPRVEKNDYIYISQFQLKEAINQTIFAVSNNATNIMMNCLCLKSEGNNLKLTALDGHRIALRNIKMKDEYNKKEINILSKNINEINKIIEADEEKFVYIYFNDNYILFDLEHTLITSRIVNGDYFNMEHMLSKDYETKVSINRNSLLNAIEQAIILIRENAHMPIILDIYENTLEVKLESSIGKMNKKVSCSFLGKTIKIALNPKFVIDVLKAVDDEEINMYFSSNNLPCFIRDDEEKYVYLILPVAYNF